MKIVSLKISSLISILLLLFSLYFSVQLISLSKENQKLKIDEAEVNSILNGLLNADEWKTELSTLISAKIDSFKMTPENQEVIKSQVENMLYRLLNEVDAILKNDMGRVKKFLMNAFVDIDTLRENVPQLAETLLEEMEKPENKENLKRYFSEKLDEYSEETFNNDEQKKLNQILDFYHFNDKKSASVYLQNRVEEQQNQIRIFTLLLLAVLILTFILNYFSKNEERKIKLLFLLVTSLIFLVNGISIPMIDIEAKISQIIFQLLGQNIVFYNQVLFFQSKSILDVVVILISTYKIDMVLVGSLIFIFSVLFPGSKIICSDLSIQNKTKYRSNKWVAFFTNKSGKWSMADVFVVAIFMAFIGFNGIINDQLSHLNGGYENVQIVTHNGTFLQPGFYLFLLFCVSGLFLGEKIKHN